MPLDKQEPLMNQELLLKYHNYRISVKLQKVIERIEKCSSCRYYSEEDPQDIPEVYTGMCYNQFPLEQPFPVHLDSPACCFYSCYIKDKELIEGMYT